MDHQEKFSSAEKSKKKKPFSKLELVHVFSHHFHVRIWRVLFTSLSADEFQMSSKSALYLNAFINASICMNSHL